MKQNSLFMVVKDTNYTNRVPVQLGTLHINEALAVVMREEYGNLSVAWAAANLVPSSVTLNLDGEGKEKLRKPI